MHEGLDHLRSIVVVPDSASGVCAKTNAGENTLVGPTRVVTTINFVAHGFDSAKNKKHAVLATFSFPEAVIVLISAKDILALSKRIVVSRNKNGAKQSRCQSPLNFLSAWCRLADQKVRRLKVRDWMRRGPFNIIVT